MRLRCAILDDYQNVALAFADWSKVEDDIEITVFNGISATPIRSSRRSPTFRLSAPCVSAPPFRAP